MPRSSAFPSSLHSHRRSRFAFPASGVGLLHPDPSTALVLDLPADGGNLHTPGSAHPMPAKT